MPSQTTLTRRRFVLRAAGFCGGLAVASAAARLSVPSAFATNPSGKGYGPLAPVKDQSGETVLALPRGFRYVTFSRIGSPIPGGGSVPPSLDGMGAFPGPDGTVRLIRNHEIITRADRENAISGPPAMRYDSVAGGGCITVDFDPKTLRVVREFVSLNGTLGNCAGGAAWKNAGWLSCEETGVGPKQGWTKPHGYVFFVPANASSAVKAVPLAAMGRFAHEAAIAGDDGTVYMTEDPGGGAGVGFYRFKPRDASDLAQGGSLQMLAIAWLDRADLRGRQIRGRKLPVKWVTIDRPDPNGDKDEPSVFRQGFEKGGAVFTRLEGIAKTADGQIIFTSTNGGEAQSDGSAPEKRIRHGLGQVWRYVPPGPTRGEHLVLEFESNAAALLDAPDNVTVMPNGDLLLCEDDATSGDRDVHPLAPNIANVNRLIGLTRSGETFEFAVNMLNDSELAGACFSPDGKILFVNVYGKHAPGSGMTCAIFGPW